MNNNTEEISIELDFKEINNIEAIFNPKNEKNLKEKIRELNSGEKIIIDFNEIEKILDLENKYLHKELDKRIVGNSEAKNAIVNAISKRLNEFLEVKGPIGCLFFAGPTGTGKTEICKALAEICFGNRNSITKINCEVLNENNSTSSVFGSPKGYIGSEDKMNLNQENIDSFYEKAKENGTLNEIIEEIPGFNILLFDEIEKAHPDFLQSLLSIMNDGEANFKNGEKANLKNSIIIFTSNIGQKEIINEKSSNNIGFSNNIEKNLDENEIIKNSMKNFFSPEFIGRLDNIVYFKHLTKEESLLILRNYISKINSEIKKYNIEIDAENEILEKILEEGYSKEKGARELLNTFNKYTKSQLGIIIKELNKNLNFSYKIQIKLENEKILFEIFKTESFTNKNIGKNKGNKNKNKTFEEYMKEDFSEEEIIKKKYENENGSNH